MKKLFLIAAAALMAACSQPETGYTVNVTVSGDLTKLPNDTLIFSGGTRNAPVVDTAVLVNGKCSFKGETNTPSNYSLSFKGGRFLKRVFLENEKFDVTFDASDLRKVDVVGGTVQTFLNETVVKREEFMAANKIDSLLKNWSKLSDEERENARGLYKKCEEMVADLNKAYVEQNPTSPYALTTLASSVEDMPLDEFEAKLAAFDTLAAYANNEILKETKETVALIKTLQPGNKAPDFVQNDTEGNPVKFSDIYSKNKITMVDFWASWCGPCRAFNPELVKIYKKYHKKGFEIIGVSNDSSKEAWLKGIKDDKLSWPQVSDLKGWNNEVGKMYYVRYIPQNIFVDQNGVIIGRQVNKADIEKLIEENLKK